MTDLQLSESETTSGSDTAVVLDGRASHNRSELVGGTGRDLCGFGDTGVTAADFLAGLFDGNQTIVSRKCWRK